MCQFKAGDVVKGPHNYVYWFINDDQYVALEVCAFGADKGHQGLYLSGNAKNMKWDPYTKICTIDEVATALLKVEV